VGTRESNSRVAALARKRSFFTISAGWIAFSEGDGKKIAEGASQSVAEAADL
jgi:hypothetical protein